MQSPGNKTEDVSRDFNDGGWAADYWEPVMAQVKEEAMAEPYDILFGRRTFDTFAEAHANSGPEAGADTMTQARKYVVTSRPESVSWSNSVAVTGDIRTEVEKLKQQDGPLIQVHGSWQLVQELLRHNLVDEFRIWTFPVVVGRGKRLFEEATKLQRLKLQRSAPSGDSGAQMAIYRP